jgi:NADH oxidase (H2O-forming)
MAEAISAGASGIPDVRVSLYDLEGGETGPFVDLIEEADALLFGSPTINGDAVKPVWDLLSSLAVVNLKGKLGGAFGSFGWSGEAVPMIEDRMRGLKMRIPQQGLRVKLIPSDEELESCRAFGKTIAEELVGKHQHKEVIDLADLI